MTKVVLNTISQNFKEPMGHLFFLLPVPTDYFLSAMHILLVMQFKQLILTQNKNNLNFSCTASYISPDSYIVGDWPSSKQLPWYKGCTCTAGPQCTILPNTANTRQGIGQLSLSSDSILDLVFSSSETETKCYVSYKK